MQTRTLVVIRHIRKAMGRLECEFPEDLSLCLDGSVNPRVGWLDHDLGHTPVASPHAMTCNWGRTRAPARSASPDTRSQSQRYREATAPRKSGGDGTGVPAERN